MVAIDIVVPSFRLQAKYLLSILQIDIPPEMNVRFIVIADNPNAAIPNEILPFIDNEKVILIRNSQNLGVCRSRNIGIDNSKGDWILFLDDDVLPSKNLLISYSLSINKNPSEVGFFGDVVFPAPINHFTNGIRASGLLTLFSVSHYRSNRKWAPTANVIVKRSAIGDIRFNEIFAKAGAGEEIDFFLRIYRNTRRDLLGIKNAQVYHDWWYEGNRKYTRFIRWNTGIALLTKNFPAYSYSTFPNVIESLVFALPLAFIICFLLHSFLLFACVFAGIIMGECVVEFLQLLKSKGFAESRFVLEVVLIRAANDLGRLKMLSGICRRFNFSCDVKNIPSQRFWAGFKFIAYLLFSVGLYCVFKLLKAY